jgi:GNAT superfamily N-acetyltransferase
MEAPTIVIAREEHSAFIAASQLKMAIETESLQLDAEIVSKAVSYFIASTKGGEMSTQGLYLVRLVANKPVGSLLLTFETPRKWWIQSVYVEASQRRQGHFTALFGEAVKLASEHHAVSLKLYAE